MVLLSGMAYRVASSLSSSASSTDIHYLKRRLALCPYGGLALDRDENPNNWKREDNQAVVLIHFPFA